MKIRKGRIELERSDTRVGNFVVSDLADRIKVQDIRGRMAFSASKASLKGRLLESMLNDGAGGLKGVVAVTWNFLSVIPDMEFLKGVNRLCVECMGRHPEMYGVNPDASEADHESDLEEAREDEEARLAFAKKNKGDK